MDYVALQYSNSTKKNKQSDEDDDDDIIDNNNIDNESEVINDDEYLEVTPHSVRLRKQFLKEGDRVKAHRGGKK